MLLVITILATALVAKAAYFHLEAFSYPEGELPIIVGANPDNSLWRYEINNFGLEAGNFEIIGSIPTSKGFRLNEKSPSYLNSPPTLLYLEKNNTVTEVSLYDPEEIRNLNGSFKSVPNAVQSDNLGEEGLVGLGTDGHAWYWSGLDWDGVTFNWTDIGGDFLSSPIAVSNYSWYSRDFFGVATNNTLLHKNLAFGTRDSLVWLPSIKTWDEVNGSLHDDQVRVTYYRTRGQDGPRGKYSLWTLDNKRSLLHKRADETGFSDWENLGGTWAEVPSALEWKEDQFEVWGRNSKNSSYWYKSYNGTHWNPEGQDWLRVGASFSSKPVVVRTGTIWGDVIPIWVGGVADNATLLFQSYFVGKTRILPSPDYWSFDVANVTEPPPKSIPFHDDEL